MKIVIALVISGLPVAAAPQAAAEAALGASRAATGVAAPAQKVGKGIASAMEKLNRTLQDSAKDKQGESKAAQVISRTARDRKPSVSSESPDDKVSEIQYEHPSGIREGMEIAEVSKRFGPPSLKISGLDQETYCYATKDGMTVDVVVRANKVAFVQTSGTRTEPASTAVQQK